MSREDQRAIGRDIAKLWFGWPIGFPARRPLAAGPLGSAFVVAERPRGARVVRVSRW
jgi:hypothetical protein